MTQQIDELLYKIYHIYEDLDTEIILRSQFEHLEAQLKHKDEQIKQLKEENLTEVEMFNKVCKEKDEEIKKLNEENERLTHLCYPLTEPNETLPQM